MTLSARLWADNGDLAAAALAHPFVSRLGDGSLPREIFASYVAQDAFFLESFARAYALALARRRSHAERHIDELRPTRGLRADTGIVVTGASTGPVTSKRIVTAATIPDG